MPKNTTANRKKSEKYRDSDLPTKKSRSSRVAKRSEDRSRSASRTVRRRRVSMASDSDNEFCSCPHPRPSQRSSSGCNEVSMIRESHMESRSHSQSRAVKLNQNGQLIAQAILDLNKVATFAEIMTQLMLRLGCTDLPASAYDTVAYTLNEGVRYGFIQMEQGGYCILPTPITLAEEDEALKMRELMESMYRSEPLRFKPSSMSILTCSAPTNPRTRRK